MACTNCDETLIFEGAGITITGTGTPTNPYIITTDLTSLGALLKVQDSDSVNLSLYGLGTPDNPLQLRADSTLGVRDLTDVQDPQGGPSNGESLVWVTDHFEFSTLPPAPAGSVNVANGITGTGAVGTPIRAATSGVWGTAPLSGLGSDSTIGQVIYVDSNGQLRAAPISASPPAWASITGKPTAFPPAAHTHVAADITDQSNINAGKVGGITQYLTANSTTAPPLTTSPAVWFFPEGT